MSATLSSEEFDPKKYLRTLQRRWRVGLLTALVTIALAAVAASTRKPNYEAAGELLIESDRKSSLTGVGGKIGTLESLKREATPLDTQALVLKSMPLRSQVIQTLQLRDKTGQPLDPTQLPVEVEVVVGTDVLRVKYKDGDRAKSAAVVNQLMAAYIAQNRKLNNTEATVAKSFIDQELPQAEAELERSANALQEYRSGHQIVALDKESTASVETLQKLTEQIQQTRSQLADAAAQQAQLQSQITQPAAQAVQAAALSQTPAVQTVLTELRQVEMRRDVERTRYRPDHPSVQQLDRQVAKLQANLDQRIAEVTAQKGQPVGVGQLQVSPLEQKLITDAAQLQVRQAGLRQQLTALQQMQAGFGDRQQALPQFVKNEEGLKQQFDLAQKNYSSLRSKQSEIRLAEIQSTANARVLQPALLPRSASNQSRNLLLLAGCGAGAFLGIAAAFGADMLDRHLKTADEIRVGLPYSLLGLIPRFDPALKRVGHGAISLPGDRRPAIGDRLAQEAFRMLQTNLKFLRPDHKCQTIVISSALAAEGKSTVAAHLASTMAQSGHRVLLIDANLRSPVQHTLWDLVNHTGLSDWMVAAPVDVQVDVQGAAVVQPVMDKLDVMTAGVVLPDATTSLESTAFRQHLAALALSYDYVLIDAPPLLGTADAVLLSKIADGLLLVARLGVVDDRSARAVQDLLHRSGATVLGLVVNYVDRPRGDSALKHPLRRFQNPAIALPEKV